MKLPHKIHHIPLYIRPKRWRMHWGDHRALELYLYQAWKLPFSPPPLQNPFLAMLGFKDLPGPSYVQKISPIRSSSRPTSLMAYSPFAWMCSQYNGAQSFRIGQSQWDHWTIMDGVWAISMDRRWDPHVRADGFTPACLSWGEDPLYTHF